VTLQVIGTDRTQMNNGNVMYMPLPELQALTGWGQATDSLWLTSTGKTHASIDSLAWLPSSSRCSR